MAPVWPSGFRSGEQYERGRRDAEAVAEEKRREYAEALAVKDKAIAGLNADVKAMRASFIGAIEAANRRADEALAGRRAAEEALEDQRRRNANQQARIEEIERDLAAERATVEALQETVRLRNAEIEAMRRNPPALYVDWCGRQSESFQPPGSWRWEDNFNRLEARVAKLEATAEPEAGHDAFDALHV